MVEDTRAPARPRESVAEIVRTVIYALLIALVFRTVLFQPFSIPSGSMKSTLLIGDYLFVSKYAYGYSKYSLPYGHLIPDGVLEGRLLGAEPERGDVIVFRNPNQIGEDYIKRVIGLPGDTIRVSKGVVFINGEPLEYRAEGDFVEPRVWASNQKQVCSEVRGQDCAKSSYVETLPNGRSHTALFARLKSEVRGTDGVWRVPAGQYFFMGDNRDNSTDSRSALGFVEAKYLIGRAERIFLSSRGAFWEIWRWRGDRFFKSIE